MEEATSKVHVRLDVEDGWPPVAFEALEARPLRDDCYQLLSPPTFAVRLAIGDVVSVELQESSEPEQVWVDSVVKSGGHSTVRVVFFPAAGREAEPGLRRDLEGLGARVHDTGFQSLIAVDIPGEVDYRAVRELLSEGESQELWEFDEGAISRLHDYES
ncbi:hypothetical protein ABH920_006874 [Catenulispora sp. EB89]|uniref:DUF4265 domain-containing protein n=1 Tax=Catenulispora sp. EB89 TaxID=3156257 RepID=UPI0035140B32